MGAGGLDGFPWRKTLSRPGHLVRLLEGVILSQVIGAIGKGIGFWQQYRVRTGVFSTWRLGLPTEGKGRERVREERGRKE